jgi:predicted adenine nucleotide alpha hydrolase (AANH) superfamily ATPase
MKKILFHICCGPCATASVTKLQEEGYETLGFYFNPNIYPKSEYEKRLKEAKKFADEEDFQFIIPNYDPKLYAEAVRGHEDNQEERCRRCWRLRLNEAAKMAKELGFKEFGSSLRISPYQNQTELLALAKEIAVDYGLKFYDLELTPLYQDSVKMSKERKMYRQRYCGCRYSRTKV